MFYAYIETKGDRFFSSEKTLKRFIDNLVYEGSQAFFRSGVFVNDFDLEQERLRVYIFKNFKYLDIKALNNIVKRYDPGPPYWHRYKTNSFEYRKDPVPFTGKTRWSFKNHKMPRTTQERRQSLEFPEFVRTKRNYVHLPNAWDDVFRGRHPNKNWKWNTKLRKQWMK